LTSVELTLENLADCAPLAKLVNLKKLRINYGKYKSFDFLKPLNTLENLFLYMPPPEPSKISALAGKTKLKQLALGDANITDITPLKDAASLEFLSLYGTKVADLKPLAAIKSLRRLMLSKIPAKDLNPVGELAELTELTIDQTDFADYTPLAKCTKLRVLQAQLSTLDKLEIIKTMPELRSFDVLKDTKAQQWEALKTAKNLDFLQIAETSFSDLSLIAHMDKLHYLYIGKTTVIHPEAISALPELGTLGIVETQGISDVSIFKTLPKLETLYIKKGQFPQAQLDALKAANPKLRFSEY
jgi:Leucine-rich repeat (LRR) protein